jgi:ABC-2 type transport system permease protein/lipopolysaccharide transport system permease protein
MLVDFSAIPESPPRELRFRRKLNPWPAVRDLWRTRDFTWALTERGLRARYKQALLGVAWAIIPPFVTMVVLTLFVQKVVTINTGGVPYALFSYIALLPWGFFSNGLSNGSTALLNVGDLLRKAYCPREAFAISSVITSAVDTLIAVAVLFILFAYYTFVPKPTVVWVPLLIAVEVVFTIGTTLLLAALVVHLRDLKYVVPLIVQMGLFATPIAYGIDKIPHHLQLPYSIINPLAPVIDGFRRTVLLGKQPDWHLLWPATVASFIWLGLGYVIFKRLETGFADVI